MHSTAAVSLQPLIVYGMHRSGTSLTVRLLADVGIHMGSWLSRDAEAVHFQRLNRRIYRAAGSTWADVEGIVAKMRSEAFVAQQTEATERRLLAEYRWFRGGTAASPSLRRESIGTAPTRASGTGSPLARFFGPDLWLQMQGSETEHNGRTFWGWKDPRTTLTLPVWARIFPQGRYLHVLRNGIDVAISIHRRSRKQQRKLRNRLLPIDYSPATLDFGVCYQLWEDCVSSALEHRALIPAEQHLEMRYEDLLAEPVAELRRVLEFVGYPVTRGKLAEACERIEPKRQDRGDYAATYRDEIQALQARPLMRELGYLPDAPSPSRDVAEMRSP